jgi:hypothetical protein
LKNLKKPSPKNRVLVPFFKSALFSPETQIAFRGY